MSAPSVPFTNSAPTCANNGVKTEDLTAILECITETFVKALTANNNGSQGSSSFNHPPWSDPTSGCNYCSEQLASPVDHEPSIEIEEEPVRPTKNKVVPEVVIPVQCNKATQPEPEQLANIPQPEPPIHPFIEGHDDEPANWLTGDFRILSHSL
ncbi:hypothetical protein PILCRDRAFT_11961 [Piloderma croceum F 1598]|uniref:Uncharacterized protein n=1 Tax=Piloderma croceum (strain F 1598) TaxID=765440 RepID=A0A0C3FCD2_PILCF|nr:hypothetical protein PILCRDRAFT_11961 [Piloderma croceum F 1598]